ncbi:MarR family transcriptional regulator [Actinoplanes sp. NPDC089786]|uniref:MarR family winged helix-turn-helix transcriptional regulator n=1 Tax=Actinoplanes sp. NPDC089786 TaxID=3155185 RepID=UPI003443B4AC
MTSPTPKASPSLSQSMNRVARALARHGDAALRPLGLRFAQIPVFVLLKTRTEMTQKALADAAGIEQPSMAQLLARMERDGLIAYRPHPTDARSRTIILTDPGDHRIGEGSERLKELERRAVEGLSEREVKTLKGLLARVLENLER